MFRVSRSYGPGRYDLEYEERGLDYPIGYVRWTEQRNIECVLELLARDELELADLVAEEYPVSRAEEAYARLVSSEGPPARGALVLSYVDSRSDNGGAADTAPRVVSPSTNGARRSAQRGLGARTTVRIGLIGPGSFASRIIVPALLAAGARLEAVGGGSGPSTAAAGRTLGFRRALESAGAVIDDPDVDAVAICTRHANHAALATRALRAGKHVFCEKPLALTEEDLAEVMAEARSSEGILAVGFNRRFSPLLCEVRTSMIDGGPITAHYRIAAGRLATDHWAHDLSQGGGRVLGEGCHFIDCMRFLTGS